MPRVLFFSGLFTCEFGSLLGFFGTSSFCCFFCFDCIGSDCLFCPSNRFFQSSIFFFSISTVFSSKKLFFGTVEASALLAELKFCLRCYRGLISSSGSYSEIELISYSRYVWLDNKCFVSSLFSCSIRFKAVFVANFFA